MSVSNSSSMYNNKYYYNTGKCHDNSTGSFLSGRCKKFNKITMMECPCQAHLTRLYFSIMWKMVAMDGFSITPHTQQRKYGMFIVLILSYPVKFYESHAVSGLVMSPMQYAGLLWVPCSKRARKPVPCSKQACRLVTCSKRACRLVPCSKRACRLVSWTSQCTLVYLS